MAVASCQAGFSRARLGFRSTSEQENDLPTTL